MVPPGIFRIFRPANDGYCVAAAIVKIGHQIQVIGKIPWLWPGSDDQICPASFHGAGDCDRFTLRFDRKILRCNQLFRGPGRGKIKQDDIVGAAIEQVTSGFCFWGGNDGVNGLRRAASELNAKQ